MSTIYDIERLEKENDALRAELAQVRMESSGTYCVYCGERFAFDGKAAELVGQHIRICEKHPMRAVEAELSQARQEIKVLNDWKRGDK